MNIAILGLTATSYGSLTYLKSVLPHLAQLDSSNNYEIFLPPDFAPELNVQRPNFRVHVPRSAPRSGTWRVLWEQLVLPWTLRASRIDAVYTTQNLAILLSSAANVIIMQNVEPFFAGQFPNPVHLRTRLWLLRKMSEFSLRRSARIIAISDWEKEFLIERFHLPAEKIIVSYPGVTEGFRPPAAGSGALLRERLGLTPPYILSVTRLAGYGNLLNLVRAYVSLVKAGKLDMPLVVPGEVWDWRYIGAVKKFLAQEGCADRVKFPGYVSHEHMPLLFGHATCFVFPSLLEACGTVLIEALACGTPILCCRRRPMMDICGDAAVLFDGEDPADIADRILEVLANVSLREGLSRRGIERATQFSWRRGAEKVYQTLMQLAPHPLPAKGGDSHTPMERRA
ncbi:MAG TPA: glycosyltransferase family 1 protein [Terriglobia bacterium]|nr:glycosyltransferase family 1 protein [Terriglobia bacterium]